MRDVNEQFIAIARRVVTHYTTNVYARAAAVLGSVARGQSDPYSDIDLAIYYDTLPTEEVISAGREALDSTHWFRIFDASPNAVADSFVVAGVECQVIHSTVAQIEDDLNAVLKDFATSHEKHAVIGGIRDALPLFGEPAIAAWQARTALYPDGLARAVVRDHLKFWPYQILEQRIIPRDAPLFFHQAVMDDAKNLLSALSGLNRCYPQLSFKRLDAYIARMQVTPLNVSARLRQVLSAEPHAAVTLLRALIEETFALVEHHMPDVDTTEARQRFARTPHSLPT